MNKEILDSIKKDLVEIENKFGEKEFKKINMEQLERIIIRLDEFSNDCKECDEYTNELSAKIKELKNYEKLRNNNMRDYNLLVKGILSHLERVHKLVPKDHYTGSYLAIGMSIGLVIGLVIFDNIALGLPLGLSIGIAIGSAKDAEAKKNDMVI